MQALRRATVERDDRRASWESRQVIVWNRRKAPHCPITQAAPTTPPLPATSYHLRTYFVLHFNFSLFTASRLLAHL